MNSVDKVTGRVDLFIPLDLKKSVTETGTNSKTWTIKGYATTPDLDLQDDIIKPSGIDISQLLAEGYINYEHYAGDEYRIGAPVKTGTFVDDVGLFLEAKLYKSNPHASSMWNLAKNVHDSGIERKLGFSIEGYALERNRQDPRIIEKTVITGVAVTTNPANPHATWEAFMKSFLTGHGVTPETQTGAAALRRESFGQSLHNLSFAYKNFENSQQFHSLWKDVGEYLDALDRYSPEAAVMFLQLSKGLSRADAIVEVEKFESLNLEGSKSNG